jgi:uncharacterized protein
VADQRAVVVVGTGVVSGIPDHCVLQLSLNGIGNTAAESLDVCSTAARGAIDSVIDAGVAREDIRTVNIAVQDYFDPAQQKVTARIGSYQVEVVVRRLDDASGVLGALSDSAGDALQIRGLQLGMRDAESARKWARREAVRDAQERARDLAEAAGLQLGEILAIEDSDRSGFSGVRAMKMASVHQAASMPVEPGQISVSALVTITYAIAG